MRRAVAALLLVAAACGGGAPSEDGEAAPLSTTTSTTAPVATTAAEEEVANADAADPDAPSPEGPAAPPSAEPAPGSAAASAEEGPAPVPAGTYRYRQSGSFKAGPQTFPIPPEGTAEVDPPTAENTQRVRRYVDPERDPNETWVRYEPGRVALQEIVVPGAAGPTRCTFDPPLTIVAWPVAVGASSSGAADCSGVTIDYAVEVTGRVPVTIDGATYDAYVLASTITTTGELESRSEQVDHFVAELRMSTRSETHTTGTYRGFAFESTLVAELVSAVPA